jgi:hypothetical protein
VALLHDACQVRGCVSLCQRREIALVLGQQIARPEAHLRYGLCDELEVVRRGWGDSGPAYPLGTPLQLITIGVQ